MADNFVDLVRKAETEAEDTTRAAAKEAAQILADAEKEAMKMAQEAENTAKAKAGEKVDAANAASQKALQEALISLDEQLKVVEQQAKSQQEEAVKIILAALA